MKNGKILFSSGLKSDKGHNSPNHLLTLLFNDISCGNNKRTAENELLQRIIGSQIISEDMG